jgi:hypothetical protein
MLTMSWAIARAAGIPWLGRRVERGRALLCFMEMSPDIRDRLRRLSAGMGVDFGTIFNQSLFIYPRSKLNPADPEALAHFKATLRAARADTFMIDNQSEMVALAFPENSNAANADIAVRAVLGPLRDLVRESPGLAGIILNHAASDGSSKGSKAAPALSDHEITLHRVSRFKKDSAVHLRFRSRFGGHADMVSYRMVGDGTEPIVPTGLDKEPKPVKNRPAMTKKEQGSRRRMVDLVAEHHPSRDELTRAFGGNRNTAIRLAKALETEGVIELVDDRWVPVAEE